MIYRLLLPKWAKEESPNLPTVVEGEFTDEQIQDFNIAGYNVYHLPNRPLAYDSSVSVVGAHIDNFIYCFVDMDLKDGTYASKEEFTRTLGVLPPTRIVDSGNGIHAYWKVDGLDAMSYLKLTRRLMRYFNTDEAVGQIFQLMRTPGTVNTKNLDDLKICQILSENDSIYTPEQLDQFLPPLTHADEEHCKRHYNMTYKIDQEELVINDTIPLKFMELVRKNQEVKDIWSSPSGDRSKGDYRLGHIMHAQGFTKEEAASVLVNSAKALGRGPQHRITYASNIIDKIWIYEATSNKLSLDLSATVADILNKFGNDVKAPRFSCYKYLDNTEHGFRLGQVIGLVAGSGVGKTAVALNMFKGFVENNPDYDHFFVPLEQPANEIADRWKTMCGDNTQLYSKVHIISNYSDDGSFRHLSLDEIKDYILKFQLHTERKVGCVVIDHIGALKKKGRLGENQDLMETCHRLKSFAIETNTLLVMQSQAPREKAGIGDLELNKDAAYGTVFFESYCDFLITLWQPLKRCYSEEGCPTVSAFKFCKIRHKKQHADVIKEDVPYSLIFDSQTELLREMTQQEEQSFKFFLNKATNKRKLDRKTDLVEYVSARTT